MATYTADSNLSDALLYTLKQLGRPDIYFQKEQLLFIEAIYIYILYIIYIERERERKRERTELGQKNRALTMLLLLRVV